MEVRGLGACMLIDTAGFDDEGELGALRVQKTCETIPKTDIALLVCSEEDLTLERIWSANSRMRGQADCCNLQSGYPGPDRLPKP